MIAALLAAVANPPATGMRVVEVPEIRRLGLLTRVTARDKV